MVVKIQIWAPRLKAPTLVQGLSHTHLSPSVVIEPSALQPDVPLLLVYSDPLAWTLAADPTGPAAGAAELFRVLPQLLAANPFCRLVNISCVLLPVLVAWCIEPSAPLPLETQPNFSRPDPFEALLAIEWLREHPEHLQAYQSLEAHPLAAALDRRPPDLTCVDRYRQAATFDALRRACHERAALDADLRQLVAQQEPLREQGLEVLALREQLSALQSRLQEAEVLKARCVDLQLSLQASQQDLEQLASRLSLFEELVAAGSEASRRVLGRLAQALA
jgi:hypothetical protein